MSGLLSTQEIAEEEKKEPQMQKVTQHCQKAADKLWGYSLNILKTSIIHNKILFMHIYSIHNVHKVSFLLHLNSKMQLTMVI